MVEKDYSWLPSFFPIVSESSFPNHVPCENAQLFDAIDDSMPELEFLNWMHSTIRLLKPQKILETGGFWGFNTVCLAHACKLNNFGKVYSVELSAEHCHEAEKLLQRLNLLDYAEIIHSESLNYVSTTKNVFDIGFFNTARTKRAIEAKICLDTKKLTKMAVFHESGRCRNFLNGDQGAPHSAYVAQMKKIKSHAMCNGFFDSDIGRGFTVLFVKKPEDETLNIVNTATSDLRIAVVSAGCADRAIENYKSNEENFFSILRPSFFYHSYYDSAYDEFCNNIKNSTSIKNHKIVGEPRTEYVFSEHEIKKTNPKYKEFVEKFMSTYQWNWDIYNQAVKIKHNCSSIFRIMHMWRKRKLAFDMIQHEKFDIFIHARMCVQYRYKFNYDVLGNIEPNTVYIPANGDYEGGINDGFAFGDYDSMKKYFSLVDNIKQYFQEGCVFHPEILLRYHLERQNLKIKRFPYLMWLKKGWYNQV